MEDDSWSYGLSASSRAYQSTLKSSSDFYIDLDDFDGDDDMRVDFPCPFCAEDFDIVGLCCHIDDEHQDEPNSGSGVCPVCAMVVGMNMVGHITTQHVNFIKGQQKLKHHKDEYSTYAFSRKELQDEHYRSIFAEPISLVSTSKMALDPLLSFLQLANAAEDKPDTAQPNVSDEVSLEEKLSEQALLERVDHKPPVSDKDQEEKALRSKFAQGLLLSTFLDDDL
ncbi:protein DEHYDRATION-INDUCED 19 homolog 3-like [Humulus lupulus]|uniref:protein DEHYDRATION-INDUCED 19 homolog 3-like n=1 Tax=Humulus lupulus TaxID=3486 RepID=UPI002B406653|nr:protein DEHYDRATION-INDUCED 19 homolog 3-like [Humulus lupulus]